MISVIVPVYNAEKYIKQTVEAIQNQDYQELEILLINDGSKDNSLRICQEIARADDRVRVFDQANCGVSKARNRGLQEARGEYFMIVCSNIMRISYPVVPELLRTAG